MFNIEKVLKFSLTDESSFLLLREAITSDLAIANPYYLQIAKFYNEFYTEYKTFPKKGDVKTWLATQPDNQKSVLTSAVQHIYAQDTSTYTKEYVEDKAIEGLRELAAKNAVKRLEATGNITPQAMQDALEKVNKINATTLNGVASVRDVHKWLHIEEEHDVKYKTGIQKLDSFIGGVGEELVFVLAGTGVGKTTYLINMAKQVASEGGKVLHISLELFTKATLHRYYRRIAEARRDEFFESYDDVRGLVDHWLRWNEGEIHVVYYPAFSISVNDVKSIVRQYVDQHGGVDLIVLDYLDLLSADTGYGKAQQWEKLGRMSHEIRSLCSEYSTTVASAAQANREGLDAHSLTMKHMAGSVQKLQAADLVFGLVQDEEELLINQGRLGVLKARENKGRGEEIPLYVDMDRMLILDVDHPDSQRLIRQQMEEQNNVLGRQLYA